MLIVAYSETAIGLGVIAASVYYAYVLVVYYLYLYQNKSLHWLIIPISVGLVIATSFAVMIYSFTDSNFDNFYGFSVTYLVINFLLFALSVYLLLRDIRNRFDRPNFFSPHGTPIFKYDPETKSVKKNSRSLMFWLATWVMFYVYTLLMEIFIADVYIGVSASMIFFLIMYLTFLYFTTYNCHKAGKIKK